MGKHNKKRGTLKIISRFLVILLIILVMGAGIIIGFMYAKLNKIQIDPINIENIGITEQTKEELSKYRNIALFGIDTRKDDYGIGNRSDCIMIASINEQTKDIKLISVYRDTYIQMENKGKTILDKATHAYAYGGAQNILKALNTNLDLNITEYVTVNFDAVITAIDAMGGVEINIENNEIVHANKYIEDMKEEMGVSSELISKAGKQTLNGVQALAYSRVRYTAGGDYKRTERMRTVLEAMLNKAKTLNIIKLNKLVDTILPRVSTNITSNEIIGLIPNVASFNINESNGWPYKTRGTTTGIYYGIPVTLESNVEQLHREVFGQENYKVNETIKKISDEIVNKTGYKE